MKQITINWYTGKVETFYRGARTVRYFYHMKPESRVRLANELSQVVESGHAPQWLAKNEWLYMKGAAA